MPAKVRLRAGGEMLARRGPPVGSEATSPTASLKPKVLARHRW